VSLTESFVRTRYRLIPDHLVGEILSKKWIDNAVPFILLLLVFFAFADLIPGFMTVDNLAVSARQFGEFGLVVLAMMVTLVGGGIDLSVGSNFAFGNFVALALINMLGWPLPAAIPAVLLATGAVGLLNGLLIGYLRLRAFLTTLVSLIIVRAIVDMLRLKYAIPISASLSDSEVWDYMGTGTVLGFPLSLVVLAAVVLVGHVILSRTRHGWRTYAVGGSRRSAYNVGISVRATVCGTYVISGLLCGLASLLYAARLGSTGEDTGVGMEIAALTAAVLGGNSLGGGRGSVAKAIMGAASVLMLTNGVIRMGLASGSGEMVLGLTLLVAVLIDVRWLKNRDKLLSKVYVSPTYYRLPKGASTAPGSGSPYALNDKLRTATAIGLAQVEGPEDVIFDRQDNLYCGTRQGDLLRFEAPAYERPEVFAHIGGHPLGMAFDRDDNLLVCVGGMGLYKVAPDRTVSKVTDETNRTRFSVVDDSRLKLADDCDIAPDGRVFFSEATIRYEMHAWPTDALESRGNGRIICFDPKTNSTRTVLRNLVFPNGICVAHDGQSLYFAESWACRISRYWFEGPRKGQVEVVIDDLPGYPDNINRASDGRYWLALLGMRSPALDVALRMPGFRRRMARRVAPDQWLYPNINTGCVVKFDDVGAIHDALWDLGGEKHPMITSMREHKGHLYLGGISNNRVGRYPIPDADLSWTGPESYWGGRA